MSIVKYKTQLLILTIIILVSLLFNTCKQLNESETTIAYKDNTIHALSDSIITFVDKTGKKVTVTKEAIVTKKEFHSLQDSNSVLIKQVAKNMGIKKNKLAGGSVTNITMTIDTVIKLKDTTIIKNDTVYINKYKFGYIEDSCGKETYIIDTNNSMKVHRELSIKAVGVLEEYKIGSWKIKNLFIARPKGYLINATSTCPGVNVIMKEIRIK